MRSLRQLRQPSLAACELVLTVGQQELRSLNFIAGCDTVML